MGSSRCRACDSARLQVLFDLGDMPLAGNFYLPDSPPPPSLPLRVYTCHECGCVQQLEDVALDLLFSNYRYASSTVSPLLDKHFAEYASFLRKLDAHSVVEFGCNDGVLLRHLTRHGIRCCGVDISDNVCDIARQQGLDARTGQFNPRVAAEILGAFGQVDVVTGSNCFAHNRNPLPILQAADLLLKPDGFFIVEVMYAGALLDQCQWDSLYHEHATVYSLRNLSILLARHGFALVHAEVLSTHAGLLRAVFQRVGAYSGLSPAAADLLALEDSTSLGSSDRWLSFAARALSSISVISRLVADVAASRTVVAYGATARATMWFNACKLGRELVPLVVDKSPIRIGCLVPGTQQLIVSPDSPAFRTAEPNYIFVTAWNYLDQLMHAEPWFKGVWITPLPEVRCCINPTLL